MVLVLFLVLVYSSNMNKWITPPLFFPDFYDIIIIMTFSYDYVRILWLSRHKF